MPRRLYRLVEWRQFRVYRHYADAPLCPERHDGGRFARGGQSMQSQSVTSDRTPIGFWILSAALVIYVAACTGFRDQIPAADAWEHHRAVLALTQNLLHPGNPTYASDIPSVRYSPYTVGIALLCQATHLDAYRALSFAATLNTVLLCVGVWLVLRSFDQKAAAGAVLLVMISLYGRPPGYANSYALADLPWHQVNPSAFSFGLTLIAWSIWRRCLVNRLTILSTTIVALLMSCALLDHGMTGAFGILGLIVLTATAPADRRLTGAAVLGCVAFVVLGLCVAWPWYSFIKAVRWSGDRDYWFNRTILILILTQWCAPAALCALFALPLRTNPLVRTCLIGGVASLAIGLGAWAIRSPALARFPLPGLIFFHIAVGVLLHQSGFLKLQTWPGKIREMLSPTGQGAILQAAVVVLIAYFLLPQIKSVFTGRHLARPYIAKWLHRPDRQQYDRAQLADLLQDVGARDVVLSDVDTSWMIPSEHGRIVSALHYELFVPDQPQRADDVAKFFATPSEAERDRIVSKYRVQWIVLDREKLDDVLFQTLLRQPAVVREAGPYVLMRTDPWLAAAHQPDPTTISASGR
jgi:hypothetical protein